MSNAAITWALSQRGPKPSHKWILTVLANAVRDVAHVSKATGATWPPLHAYMSVASLCEVTALDRKTVLHGLQCLEGAGLITRAGTDGQTRQVTVFRLNVGTSPKNGTASAPSTSARNGTRTSPKNGTGPKNGPVPVSPATSTAFSGNQSLFSAPPVPETGHETHRNPIEPRNEPRERAPKRGASRFCSPGFEVTPELRAWATREAPLVDIDRATAVFRDHEFAKPISDWPRAWKNWIRRERPTTSTKQDRQAATIAGLTGQNGTHHETSHNRTIDVDHVRRID